MARILVTVLLVWIFSLQGKGDEIYFDLSPESAPLKFTDKYPDLEYKLNALNWMRLEGGQSALKLDLTLNGRGTCFFAVPLDLKLDAKKSYYAFARLHIEKPGGTLEDRPSYEIKLAYTYEIRYGHDRQKKQTDYLVFGSLGRFASSTDLESLDLAQEIRTRAISLGLPVDSLYLTNLSLQVLSAPEFKHERIVVDIESLSVRSSPQSVSTAPPQETGNFPLLKQIFPFGVWGGAGGYRSQYDPAGIFRETFPEPLWRAIPDLKSHWINTFTNEPGQIAPDSPASTLQNLSLSAEVFDRNHLYSIPQVYLSPYYRPDLTEAQDEAAIQKYIAPLKSSSAILGWYVIDEPPISTEALDDYLWAKKAIEAVDPNHPVLTGGMYPNSLFDSRRPVAFLDWYPESLQYRAPQSMAPTTRLVYNKAVGPVWLIIQAFHNSGFIQPSSAEVDLMSYAALSEGAKGLFYYCWRQYPTWYSTTDSGFVDTFESDTGLWKEIGKLGYYIAPIGSLLTQTEVVENSVLDISAGEIKNFWGESEPAVRAGLLRDKEKKVDYAVIYNNDANSSQTATLQLSQKGELYDLYSLSPLPSQNPLEITLAPGEGRIYLIGDQNQFQAAREAINTYRFQHELENFRYSLYFAKLSGLATPALLAQALNIKDADQLKEARANLREMEATDPDYLHVKESLDRTQSALSILDQLYNEKIRPLKRPHDFPKRPLDPSNPTVQTYLEGLIDLGSVYFVERNLFIKGQYRTLKNDAPQLEQWADSLRSQAEMALVDKTSTAPSQLDTKKVELAYMRLHQMDERLHLTFPDPFQQ
jgi:hypothetical protein